MVSIGTSESRVINLPPSRARWGRLSKFRALMGSINTVVAGQINSRLNIVRPVVWTGYAVSALGYGLCIRYLVYEGGIGNQMGVMVLTGLGVGMSHAVPLLCIQAVSTARSIRPLPLSHLAMITNTPKRRLLCLLTFLAIRPCPSRRWQRQLLLGCLCDRWVVPWESPCFRL